jgi:hypothetical protein
MLQRQAPMHRHEGWGVHRCHTLPCHTYTRRLPTLSVSKEKEIVDKGVARAQIQWRASGTGFCTFSGYTSGAFGPKSVVSDPDPVQPVKPPQPCLPKWREAPGSAQKIPAILGGTGQRGVSAPLPARHHGLTGGLELSSPPSPHTHPGPTYNHPPPTPMPLTE